MKGLILAGGTGTRLRPLTDTRAKLLIPIANRPGLFYVVENLAAAGIRDLGVVVDPETARDVESALGDGSLWGVRLTFIPQDTPLGPAHAVRVAQGFLDRDPFVVHLGDNLLSGGISHLVEEHRRGDCEAVVLLDNPQAVGVAVLDGDRRVVRLIEEPQHPPSNLALVGVYLCSPSIHDAIADLRPGRRGEYEIADALQGLIDRGAPVRAHLIRGWWKDTDNPEDILDANRLVLSHIERDVRGEIRGAEVLGNVVVEQGARIEASTIRGPAHIASGARIVASYVGPYSSIGHGARIVRSEVECSIIMDGAEVCDLSYRLDASLIGRGVVVGGRGSGPRRHTMRLVLGDRSRVRL